MTLSSKQPKRMTLRVPAVVLSLVVGALGAMTFAAQPASAVTPLSQGWTTTEAAVPAGSTDAAIDGVSCPAPGSCIAVGQYSDSSSYAYGVIETESGSTWTSLTAPQPAGAGTEADTNEDSELGNEECGVIFSCTSVSCPTTTMCVAIGDYQDSSGTEYGLIETLSNGTWTPAAAPMPSDHATGSDQQIELISVQCTSVSSCVVVGGYSVAGGGEAPLLLGYSNGTWTAETGTLPSDADTGTSADGALVGLSCATSTACVAVGEYADTSGKQDALTEVLTGTTWSNVVAPLPSNTGTDGDGNLAAVLIGVSCAAPGVCTSVGEYNNTTGGTLPLIETLASGAWTTQQGPDPSAAVPAPSSDEPALASVSCPVSTWCVATGSYFDSAGHPHAVIDTFAGGAWSSKEAPEPSAVVFTGTGTGSFLPEVQCPTVSFCQATGDYSIGGSSIAGLIETYQGGSWSELDAPTPSNVSPTSHFDLVLNGSCSSPVTCGAVGAYMDASSNTDGFMDTYTGVQGYWLGASDGGIFTEGNAQFLGSTGSIHLNKPIVGMAATPDGQGYWLVASDGGIFTEGDAQYEGSTGGTHLNQPIVGMAATPDGKGYWLVASDGGIFTEGDAQYYGSTGAIHLNKPIVGMAATPDGGGYWLVASDGGIFGFGDAQYYGSTGAIHLNKPIVGMAATPNGNGYWLVASDGGIFTFGAAQFDGSTGAINLNKPIVGMASSPSGNGYWLVASDGGIFTFGDGLFYGSTGAIALNKPIVAMAT
jgi:hypothetical protein